MSPNRSNGLFFKIEDNGFWLVIRLTSSFEMCENIECGIWYIFLNARAWKASNLFLSAIFNTKGSKLYNNFEQTKLVNI